MVVYQLLFYHFVLSTFMIIQGSDPEYLSSLQARDGKTGRIIILNTTLTLAKRRYSYHESTQWNSFPTKSGTLEESANSMMRTRILLHLSLFVDALNYLGSLTTTQHGKHPYFVLINK